MISIQLSAERENISMRAKFIKFSFAKLKLFSSSIFDSTASIEEKITTSKALETFKTNLRENIP